MSNLSFQPSDTGTYVVRALNSSGDAVSATKLSVTSPPKPDVSSKPTLAVPDTSSKATLAPESLALRTLSAHRHIQRPLPELLPFPFKPDQASPRKRNHGKVPKPSRFVKGEVYHSDYESDLEGKIPPKWRAYCSDNEDVVGYRRVTPNLRWDLTR